MALAFQRELMNRIIPSVRPDLIHCYDWMTGQVPAMVRFLGIPCLFSLYRHVLARPMADLRAMSDPGLSPRRAA